MELVVKIPPERVGVLIGRDGKFKKKLEKLAEVKIKVGPDGTVYVKGKKEENVSRAAEVVKAIGYGFSPDKAVRLLSPDYYLDIIPLKEIMRRQDIPRQKARIIGTGGTARKRLEQLTNTFISVWEKEVAIIGEWENVALAHKAIVMLAQGKEHSTVYSFLERKRRERREAKLLRALGFEVD